MRVKTFCYVLKDAYTRHFKYRSIYAGIAIYPLYSKLSKRIMHMQEKIPITRQSLQI